MMLSSCLVRIKYFDVELADLIPHLGLTTDA